MSVHTTVRSPVCTNNTCTTHSRAKLLQTSRLGKWRKAALWPNAYMWQDAFWNRNQISKVEQWKI